MSEVIRLQTFAAALHIEVVRVVALIMLLTAALPAAAQNALRVQKAEVVDTQGFGQPMLAATAFVPAGWKVQGNTVWNVQQRCAHFVFVRLQATAPDGSAAIELLPGHGWGNTNMGVPAGDCPPGQVSGPEEYLKNWVQQNRPGARWLEYRPRPDKSRPPQESNNSGFMLQQRQEAGQALIGYTQDGRDMRETLAVITLVTQSKFTGVGNSVMTQLQGQSMGVLAWRAPNGSLDFRNFDVVWNSLQLAPEFKAKVDAMIRENQATQAQIAQIQAETNRETLAQIAKRGEIRRRTAQEIEAMRNQTYADTQATNDRMHRETTRTLREVNGYRDPRNGGVVELSSHYQHAWQLGDGSYVLTDDPNFDPQRTFGQSGEQLQRTKQ